MSDERKVLGAPDLIGWWRRDLGYEDDLSNDVRLVLREDGRGAVITEEEDIRFEWNLGSQSELRVTVEGQPSGSYSLEVSEADLPRGRFTALTTDPAIVPFGLRRFTKMDSLP